jgi:hypothetical protein
MTQYVINIGALPNDGTGDPLRTAFNETNLNFDQVFAAGPVLSNIQIANNKILTTNTNGNLILAPNGIGVVQSNVSIVPNLANIRNLGSSTQRWATIYAQYLDVSANLNITGNIVYNGDLNVDGNLTVQGNIIQVGNIVTETLTIQLANAATTTSAANGSGITVGANDNIATLLYNATGNAWTTNIGVSSVGNISAPYLFGNGSQLTGLAATYGNANVVAYGESGWAGNIVPSGNAVYSLGNATNQWNDLYVSNATIFMNNVPVGLSAGNVLTVNGNAVLQNDSNTSIATTGTITANVFATATSNLTIGPIDLVLTDPYTYIRQSTANGGLQVGWDGQPDNDGIAYITFNDPSAASITLWTGNANTISHQWSFLNEGTFIGYGNINTTGNVLVGNIETIDISATGNITANYFVGNGSQLTGLAATYGNANVANYLPTFSGNISAGNVSATGNITAGNIGITGSSLTWANASIVQTSASDVSITGDGQVTVRSLDGTYQWTFESTGNLTLPGATAGETIATQGGYITVGNLLVGQGGALFNSNNDSWALYGNISDPGATIFIPSNADAGNGTPLYIESQQSNVEIRSGSSTWNFDTTGNLTLPGNTFAVNYANGGPVTFTANTGNVTFSGETVIGTGTSNTQSGLYLAPDPVSLANDLYLRVRGNILDEPTHIHFDTGNNQYYNQFIGDDNKYIQLANTGNIVINTSDYAGNTAQWNFDTTGNLTLPQGGVVYETNIPDGGLNGQTIALKPQGGTDADQQLLIYPTVNDANHLHLTTGNLYNTELYLGDDYLYVKLANTGNIVVNSNDNAGNTAQWIFGADGNLTVPGGMIINGNINTLGSQTALLQPTDDLPLAFIASGANGSVISYWAEDIANLMTSNIAAIYTPLQNTQTVRIVTGSNGGNIAIYDFDKDGVFTTAQVSATGNVTGNYFIGNGSLLTGISASLPVANGTSNFDIATANGNATITANSASTWTFGTDSALTLPASSGQIGRSGYPNGIDLYNNNGGTGYVRMNYADESLISADSGGAHVQTTGGTWDFDTTGNLTAPGNVSAVGNIIGGNIVTSGSGGDITMSGGNITGAGNISATGNITGNYFIGNGSQLTGITASVPSQTILPTIQTITVSDTSGVGNAGGGGSAFANVTVANTIPVTEYGVIITSGTSSQKYATGALGSIPGTVKLNFTTGLNNTPFTVYAYVTSNAGTYYSDSATGTSGICLLAGTQIALSDGTRKAIEDITYTDKMLSWDFDLGCYAETTALWIKRGETGSQYNLLTFSDGTTLRTFDQHRIFNKQAGAFTYPMTDATPVGTVTVNEHGQEITLTNKQVIVDTIEYYNVITDHHMNLFSDTVLTSCRFNNIYPITDMKFVKDGRTLRTRAEFENIPDRFFYGLRLAEQTTDIETVEWYVNRLLSTEVSTESELTV